VEALGDTENDAAVPVLLKAAKNDKSLKVRASAVEALGNIGTPKAREALMELLKEK
jgi:HEAT repeat protein